MPYIYRGPTGGSGSTLTSGNLGRGVSSTLRRYGTGTPWRFAAAPPANLVNQGSRAAERGFPERAEMDLINLAGRAISAPAAIAERPLGILDSVGRWALGTPEDKKGPVHGVLEGIGSIGRGLPVSVEGIVGGLGEGLERVGNLIPSLMNAKDISTLRDYAGRGDNFVLPEKAGFKKNGLPIFNWFGDNMTVGDLKAELERRGFNNEVMENGEGVKVPWERVFARMDEDPLGAFQFGDRLVNDSMLTDMAFRFAADPLNLAFGSGLLTKAARGAAWAIKSPIAGLAGRGLRPMAWGNGYVADMARLGARSAERASPAVSAAEIAAGSVKNATLRGYGTFLGNAARGVLLPGKGPLLTRYYRGALRLQLGGMAVEFGSGSLRDASSELLGEDFITTGFMNGLHDFSTSVMNDRPLSENSVFIMAAAFHNPVLPLIGQDVGAVRRGIRESAGDEGLRLFAERYDFSDATPKGNVARVRDTIDPLSSLREGRGRERALLERLGDGDVEAGRVELARLYDHIDLQIAFDKIHANVKRHFESFDDFVFRGHTMMPMLREMVADMRARGELSPRVRLEKFDEWARDTHRIEGYTDEGVAIRRKNETSFDPSPETVIDQWKTYVAALKATAPALDELGSVVLGRAKILSQESIDTLIAGVRASARDGKVSRAIVESMLTRAPALFDDPAVNGEFWAQLGITAAGNGQYIGGRPTRAAFRRRTGDEGFNADEIVAELEKIRDIAPPEADLFHEARRLESAAPGGETLHIDGPLTQGGVRKIHSKADLEVRRTESAGSFRELAKREQAMVRAFNRRWTKNGRPRGRAGNAPTELLRTSSLRRDQSKIVNRVLDRGGATYDPLTGTLYSRPSGYAVAVHPGDFRTVDPNDSGAVSRALIDVVNEYPDSLVGSFMNDDGTIGIEPSIVVSTLDEALLLGRRFGQNEVFDFAAGRPQPVTEGPMPQTLEPFTGIRYKKDAQGKLRPTDELMAWEARQDLGRDPLAKVTAADMQRKEPAAPEAIAVPKTERSPLGGNNELRATAQAYNEAAGLPPIQEREYHPFDQDFAERTAREYEALPAVDEAARPAYEAFAAETKAQWDALEAAGYEMEAWPFERRDPNTLIGEQQISPEVMQADLASEQYVALRDSIRENGMVEPIVITPDGRITDGHHRAEIAKELGLTDVPVRVARKSTDRRVDEDKAASVYNFETGQWEIRPELAFKEQPYASAAEMQADVRQNKHLWFFTGGEPHPFLSQIAIPERGLTSNDIFRAVHDIMTHAQEGFEFGARGEVNAAIKHSQMFTPLARRAMLSETHGQNSWTNYGPHNPQKLDPKDRPYADQKAALLPDAIIREFEDRYVHRVADLSERELIDRLNATTDESGTILPGREAESQAINLAVEKVRNAENAWDAQRKAEMAEIGAVRADMKAETSAIRELDLRAEELRTIKPDPSLRDGKIPPDQQQLLNETISRVRDEYPAYDVEAAPLLAVRTELDDGVLAGMFKERQLVAQVLFDYGPLGKVESMWHWLTQPVKSSRLAHDARQMVYNKLLPLGVETHTVQHILAELRERATELTIGDLRVPLVRGISSLPANTINDIARKIITAGEDGNPSVAGQRAWARIERQYGQRGFHHMLDEASNAFIRRVDTKRLKGQRVGPLETALREGYRAWQYAPVVGSTSRLASKTLYHIFRFVADVRWHMLNLIEADTIAVFRDGVDSTRFGPRRSPVGDEALWYHQGKSDLSLPSLMKAGDDMATPPGQAARAEADAFRDDSGMYLFNRNLTPVVERVFDKRRLGSVDDVLNALPESHPAIAMLEKKFGKDRKSWAQQLDEQMYSFDRRGASETIAESVRRVRDEDGWSQMEYDTMVPLVQRLTELNQRTFDDIIKLYQGNPDRSRIERIMNSFWLYWPLSYQIKATKWLLDVTMNRAFGQQSNFGGLWSLDRAADAFKQRLATNEDFQRQMEENEDAWFIASMVFPVSPADIGVSLNKGVRYVGSWLGFFPEYSGVEDPGDLGQKMLEMGPIYTAKLLNRLLTITEPDAETSTPGGQPNVEQLLNNAGLR